MLRGRAENYRATSLYSAAGTQWKTSSWSHWSSDWWFWPPSWLDNVRAVETPGRCSLVRPGGRDGLGRPDGRRPGQDDGRTDKWRSGACDVLAGEFPNWAFDVDERRRSWRRLIRVYRGAASLERSQARSAQWQASTTRVPVQRVQYIRRSTSLKLRPSELQLTESCVAIVYYGDLYLKYYILFSASYSEKCTFLSCLVIERDLGRGSAVRLSISLSLSLSLSLCLSVTCLWRQMLIGSHSFRQRGAQGLFFEANCKSQGNPLAKT